MSVRCRISDTANLGAGPVVELKPDFSWIRLRAVLSVESSEVACVARFDQRQMEHHDAPAIYVG
jgi:hypothetical protein